MALPDPLRGSGRLFLWPNCLETAHGLTTLARRLDRPLDRFDDHGCVAIHLDESCVVSVLDALRKNLNPGALESTRAVFKPGPEEPSLADFPRADTLQVFIAFARAQWLGEMMANRRLTVWFQPIVDAHNPNKVFALEALARGNSRIGSKRPVLPHRLLSAAREAGLMAAFDRHIHEQALVAFAQPYPSELRLFLNITPKTLEDPRFDLDGLLHTASLCGVDPRRITLEIIESETISDMNHMQDVLTEARALGFGIALDDLGAGFSNLNLIHRLRPDVVKLDMDLIRNIETDSYKAVLAQKILEATESLGVWTVAEGVERFSELYWLRAHGVDFVQGYLTGRPGPSPLSIPPSSLSA